jgi:hypothetical protein
MTLHELGNLYLEAARVEKGYTHETLRTFRTRIRAYIRFVSRDPAVPNKEGTDHCRMKGLEPLEINAIFEE